MTAAMWIRLFESQRVNWIEPRGFLRRIETEEDADDGGKSERHRDGIGRHLRRPRHPSRHALGNAEPERDADAASEQAQCDGLDEKLQAQVAAFCADRHPQPD